MLVSVCLIFCSFPTPGQGKEFDVSTNHWIVEMTSDGGEEMARRVARDVGFTYVGPVSISLYSPSSVQFSCWYVIVFPQNAVLGDMFPTLLTSSAD